MKKRFIILIILLLILSGCTKNEERGKVSLAFDANRLAYVTDKGTAICVSEGGEIRELGNDVKKLLMYDMAIILLNNDGTVQIYESRTGQTISKQYCDEYASESEGTLNGTIFSLSDMCAFFEENTKVEDIIIYSPDVFLAKVNGEWIGPACEWFHDVDFNKAKKMVGTNPHEPDFLLNDDGSIICLSGYYHDVKGLLGEDKKYKDVDESFETFFLGEDSKIYSQKETVALDWENVEQISVYAYNVVGVDKAGNVLLENEKSRHYEEVSTWKDVIYVKYAGDFIIGVDKAGNILATKEAVERFSLDLENLPKVRVSR